MASSCARWVASRSLCQNGITTFLALLTRSREQRFPAIKRTFSSTRAANLWESSSRSHPGTLPCYCLPLNWLPLSPLAAPLSSNPLNRPPRQHLNLPGSLPRRASPRAFSMSLPALVQAREDHLCAIQASIRLALPARLRPVFGS